MKKTIAVIAILASGSLTKAAAPNLGPNAPKPVQKTICLKVYTGSDGSQSLAECDASSNNLAAKIKLQSNGCAEGQAAIKTYDKITIYSCLPAGAVQL